MMDKDRIRLLIVLGISALIVICMIQSFWRVSTEVSTYHEIYSARLPFGVFMSSGGGSFILGTGGFSFGTDEVYLVKYFDGVELKSLELEASKTSLIVDGTFRLEEITLDVEQNVLWWRQKFVGTMMRGRRLHIPYLPEVNQTLTEDWTK